VSSPPIGAKAGKGAAELANIVVGLCEQKSGFKFVYDEQDTLWEKVNKIAKKIYRASEVPPTPKVRNQIKKLQEDGYGTIRCAWPRPNRRFPPTLPCVARRSTTWSTSARCVWLPGPNSW